ncbi:GntR family transcriptional regulator [Thalassobaculum litoreum]|uniref:Transcriptional regulator, GntR family n=1 Tax=Thalassobaculum litoreum DSM 18839 TaxID=1123362 RepID=A0A8G2EUJ7_9PROT|nr:GntR family transcriptional regulator [Thalassobaculum litoreum]SDF40866.1 transcriptional regulator, GntR family [Thalassobaculum litoreum DSM 18839]
MIHRQTDVNNQDGIVTLDPTPLPSRRSMPAEIAALLREEILDGVLAPDARLPQEHLARRFGTSQAPIREALRRLEAEGLAVSVANRGVRVAGLSAAEAEEIGALRLALEPGLAERAAGRAALVDVAAARAAIGAMERASTPAALMTANAAFHDALYAAADRPITLELVTGLRARYERYLRLMWRMTGHAALSNDEHGEILALVLAGDGVGVHRVMERHIAGSTAEILKALGAGGWKG